MRPVPTRRKTAARRDAPVAIGSALLAAALQLSMVAPATAAEGCAASSGQATLDEITVDGTRVRVRGSWSVAGAHGALLELRTDSDRQQSRSLTGAGGDVQWELDFRPGIGLCGPHILQFHLYPAVADGAGLSHCLERPVVAKQSFAIVCRPQPVSLSCTWHCAADDTTSIEWCDGECMGEIKPGLGPELPPWVPYWGLDGEQPVAGDAADGLVFRRTMSCTRGRQVTFAVSSSRRPRPSPPVSTPCGGE
jgi:hypothetical protein